MKQTTCLCGSQELVKKTETKTFTSKKGLVKALQVEFIECLHCGERYYDFNQGEKITSQFRTSPNASNKQETVPV